MSTEIVKDIICPQCGESQKYRLYTSVNAQEHPELKQSVLDETLFDWRCQRCSYFAAMAYPFVYLDNQAKYVVCLTPGGSGSAVEPTEAMRDYIKRRVKNLAELKEKVLIFDNGLDDVAVELMKNALCSIIKRNYGNARLHAYFSKVEGDKMDFAIFMPRQLEPVYHSTRVEVYNQSQEVLRTLDYTDPQGFATVDARLAKRIIDEYQSS
ncbi:CpXC domain-containing protein [Acutalibacter caecimuris]|uniref:CpXC domain-containing protein n=1 Tax=Acutalibacter caecimuris TaxID=3093657 RepID=UPI002AC993DA|nr:CpXC domain-containing protein [Acutalibacter sp. M00118]